MGEVYLAEDKKLDRKVALKFLPSGLVANDELRTRFVREAKALAKQNHPNIVTVFEVGEFGGRPFFAMEYVNGQTLRQFAESKGETIRTIIEWAIQLCQGLGEAHRNGIIHRDIKSTNVIVDQGGRIKILDFGLAAMSGSEELTKTGSTLGTVAYMSPEQVSGREADHRSDLFSFGVVLYELLAGRTPFRRDNEGATLRAIMQDKPEPLTRYKNDVPEPMQQIISKLLEKDIELRYQTAEGVLADLKRLLYDSQSVTGPVASNESDKNSIVVIPFNNISSEEDNDYFSDGLTEEIITDLSGVSEMRVISRSSAMKLKGTDKDVRAIASELNVHYILTGSVRKAGNNVRITAQLIDASKDEQVWGDKYRGTLEDVFEIQEEVSQAIVSTLKVKLTSTEKKQLAARPIEDPRAYEYYLRARQELAKWTKAGFDRAANFVSQAIEIAGENAQLLALMAHVQYQYVNTGARPATHRKVIEDYLNRALRLDPDLSEALLVQAFVGQTFGDNKQDANRPLKRIIENEPHHAEAMRWLALNYGLMGKTDEAIKLAQQSIDLDPLSLQAKSTMSFIQLMSGNFEAIERMNRELYKLDSDSPHQKGRMIHTLTYLGKLDEIPEYMDGFPQDTFYGRLIMMFYFGMRGDREKSYSYVNDEMIDTASRDDQYSLFVAWGYASNKEADKTLEWLELAFDNGFTNYPFLAKYDPHFRFLDDEPRFQDFLKRVKKTWENLEV
jgi:serine/threonine protein kinase